MGGQIANVGEYRADGDSGPEIDGDLGGKIEGGEGDSATMDHFGPVGDDSPPLPDDWVLAVPIGGESEDLIAAAYSDETTHTAEPGEKRLYARNPAGEIVSTIHMRSDGTIELANDAATIEVAADGSITLSGTSVSLQAGEALGSFLTTLHTGVTAWAPVPNDGGAALKAALATWLAQSPPSP